MNAIVTHAKLVNNWMHAAIISVTRTGCIVIGDRYTFGTGSTTGRLASVSCFQDCGDIYLYRTQKESDSLQAFCTK